MTNLIRPGTRREADHKAAPTAQRSLLARAWSFLNAPIMVVAIMAVAAHFLFAGIEERSFRRNELFKGRLQRILDAQREVVRVRADVELAFRAARSQEDFSVLRVRETSREAIPARASDLSAQLVRSSALDALRRSPIELRAIGESVGAHPDDEITKATGAYVGRLGSFLECISDPDELGECADGHENLVILVQQIAAAYSARADELLRADQ